jgi:hypothetical protein
MYFRFPTKYIVFAVFAVAVLAAEGWRGLSREGLLPPEGGRYTRLIVWLPAFAGSFILAVTLVLMAMPDRLLAVTHSLAVNTHLKDASAGAAFLARTAPPLALRAGGMLLAAALLLALGRRRPYAHGLLAALTCVDLLATAIPLNPTMEVAKLSPPAWFTAAAGPQRLYIGARVRGFMNGGDPDGVTKWQIPAEPTAIEGRMVLNAELPMAPSGWRVREALSYDLPYLWPAEYEAAVRRFEKGTPEERDAFLRRSGVRWCVVPSASPRPWRPVAEVPDWNMRVFECHPPASRLTIASGTGDLDALFDPAAPDGDPVGEARIVEEDSTHVTVDASVTREAVLVLRDSFDASWHAEVDGHPAVIERANTLHRAVRLPPGRHVIRFFYRPGDLLAGLIPSVTALLVIGLVTWKRNAASR